jgi:CheY-like chemotaxis protein
MDISMPIMDGYEATENIRILELLRKEITFDYAYIIGLTAHSTDSYKKRCYDVGMNFFSINI